MRKEEKIKKLLQGYYRKKLNQEEKENLFVLIQNEKLEDAAVCELYKFWQEEPMGKDTAASQKSFNEIRDELQIAEEKLTQDDLILKGIEYENQRSAHKYMYIFMKYAAVILIAILATFLVNYFKESKAPREIARHEISAPHGARIKILLSDSSEVWLNSGSKLIYAENFTASEREVYLEGEAFFNVRKNNYKPFYINTSKISIKVLGTSLNVKSYLEENTIETTLLTGQVEIQEIEAKGEKTQRAFLLPEQKALYNKETGKIRIEEKKTLSPVTAKVVKPDAIVGKVEQYRQTINPEVAWKDNKFVFNNEMLISLTVRLERWYNVEFELLDDEVKDYKFTGILENETIEQAMQAFKIASPIEYRFEKNKIIVWKSKSNTTIK